MKSLLRSTLLIALLASSASAFAQATDSMDAEREALSRIQYELQQLQTQVRDAARNAPTGTRVQFRYDWLASDLELINRSIQDHLDAPRQPRAIPPLKGDYRN
ncbi:RAQPRD family integrative conjugative element protein [Uliginosibacterium gangwonense]|uniref:integrative conjugative element protein, RAQPRD family n=1 Tax=Uliginosibacterium gangwonense TaxID=392736 RepID=UPI00035F94FB|nr:RAQPRD family integrative conjugative element protein [Uliginosibacterium gangwonense]